MLAKLLAAAVAGEGSSALLSSSSLLGKVPCGYVGEFPRHEELFLTRDQACCSWWES